MYSCFWGRQKDFVDTEMQLGRDVSTSTAVVGYAGGKENSKSTCYYYNAPDTLYEKQGHAEVVQVGLDSAKAAEQFGAFSETYFSQFQKTRFGMIRLVCRSLPPSSVLPSSSPRSGCKAAVAACLGHPSCTAPQTVSSSPVMIMNLRKCSSQHRKCCYTKLPS